VCNGGFHQFFANSTGVLAPEALAGFRAIGLEEEAAALAEAMEQLGTPYPREREERWDRVRNVKRGSSEGRPFSSLDERFYDCLDREEDRWVQAADAYASKVRASAASTPNPDDDQLATT
jgi:hypothetical protein